jgi:hypothetical protein
MAIGRFFGYSVPRSNTIPGILDASQLKLRYQITGNNDINPTRISGYAQVSKKFYWGEIEFFLMLVLERNIGILITKR